MSQIAPEWLAIRKYSLARGPETGIWGVSSQRALVERILMLSKLFLLESGTNPVPHDC